MRTLSRIECFNVGCTNEASVTINGDHVCTQCARADLPNELHKLLPAQDNQVCNCGQPAADDIRYSGMCTVCYQLDCEPEHASQTDNVYCPAYQITHTNVDGPCHECGFGMPDFDLNQFYVRHYLGRPVFISQGAKLESIAAHAWGTGICYEQAVIDCMQHGYALCIAKPAVLRIWARWDAGYAAYCAKNEHK